MRRQDCLRRARVVVPALTAVFLAAEGVESRGEAEPAKRTRSVLVRPDNQFGEVELDMRFETVSRRRPGGGGGDRATVRSGDAVRIGEQVVICFASSERGWVTLWSRDAEGNVPVRIYPNEYAPATAGDVAAPVEADAETCIGESDGFSLEVGPPTGEAEVYLHYTQEASEQFDETAFPQIRRTRLPDRRPYASSHLQYRVVR